MFGSVLTSGSSLEGGVPNSTVYVMCSEYSWPWAWVCCPLPTFHLPYPLTTGTRLIQPVRRHLGAVWPGLCPVIGPSCIALWAQLVGSLPTKQPPLTVPFLPTVVGMLCLFYPLLWLLCIYILQSMSERIDFSCLWISFNPHPRA